MYWKIYYEDGSTFSSEDGDVFDAPRTGVEIIVHEDSGGFSLMSQSSYYYWEPDRSDWGFNYCDQFTLVLHLQRAKRPLIFFGAMITTSQFSEIERRALAELPGKKVAWRRNQDKQSTGQTSGKGVFE